MYVTKPLSLLLILTLFSGAVLISSTVSADDDTNVVDEINIAVPVSCTLSGTGMNTHNATINNGQYNSAIGETALQAFCNDNNGFAIYAIGYTDDTDGKNVLTNSTLGSTYDIVTGTATSGNTSNWAMKLSTVTNPTPTYPIIVAGSTDDSEKEQGDPDFTAFQEVPDDYERVAYRTAGTDIGTGAEGSTLKTTYQAYISPTQPAGTYTGQVKYTLVHPYSADTPINPIGIEGAMRIAGKQKINGYYKIQDMNSTICGNVDQYGGDGMAEVIDVRDNNIYHIAKLADDRCWILDNLVLDPTDPTTANNMNESNTNATQAAIANLLNGGSTTTGWSNTAVTNITSGYGSMTVPLINNDNKNTLVTSYGPATQNNQDANGIYYNFCAATVGTYCYNLNSGVNLPNTDIDATSDLCPVNWRLPTSNEFSNIQQLHQSASDPTGEESLVYNLSITLSGYFSSNIYGQNSYVDLWSSTFANGHAMYSWNFRSNGDAYITYAEDDSRAYGKVIRCLLSQ